MHLDRPHRRLYRICDALTEGLIYFAILFGPWAFGTTQTWSIQVLNGVGLALGLLWLVKTGLRAGADRRAPEQWHAAEWRFTRLLPPARFAFCCIAWSAPGTRARFISPTNGILSIVRPFPGCRTVYDQAASWAAFWKYLGSGRLVLGVARLAVDVVAQRSGECGAGGGFRFGRHPAARPPAPPVLGVGRQRHGCWPFRG